MVNTFHMSILLQFADVAVFNVFPMQGNWPWFDLLETKVTYLNMYFSESQGALQKIQDMVEQ